MKFSILTPTKNRREWLPKSVASVLGQTWENLELIVLDLSDDPIEDVLPADPRIRYVRGGRARGPAADFQRALDLATGDIVHPVSDDDRIVPHALETVARSIGDARWLYGLTDIVGPDDTFVQRLGVPFNLPALRQEYNLGGAVYWRRELTDLLGGFNREFDHAADYDLYLR